MGASQSTHVETTTITKDNSDDTSGCCLKFQKASNKMKSKFTCCTKGSVNVNVEADRSSTVQINIER